MAARNLAPADLRTGKGDSVMDMDYVAEKGLLLLGCGKMGSAMLQGWLSGDRKSVV